MILYYDKEGEPMETMEWTLKLGDREYAQIDSDLIGEVLISTVWLGLDHGFGGRRLIFETMVFGGDFDQSQWRWATQEEARIGHDEAVRLVRTKCSSADFVRKFQKFIVGLLE